MAPPSRTTITALAMGASCYAAFEWTRYRRFIRYTRRLAASRTPLAPDFDRVEWMRFFVESLRREARAQLRRVRVSV